MIMENKYDEDEVITCTQCGEEIDPDEAKEYDGEIYCERCYDELFGVCDICGKQVMEDELRFWGDCRICPDCMAEECPEFDEEENEKDTQAAYKEMKKRFIGKKVVNLKCGEHGLEYQEDTGETEINYSIYVTIDEEGVIKDISRLKAEMLLSESLTSSETAPYKINSSDYKWVVEEIFEENLDFEEDMDD